MAIKYLYTICPSDNYLFHENSVSKYLFQKYSSPPLEIEWWPPKPETGHNLKSRNILNENQTGFRKTYSTVDHVDDVFSIKCLLHMFFFLKIRGYFVPLLITRRHLAHSGDVDYGPSSLQAVYQKTFVR